jgi:hypothetical protein
MDDVSTCPTSSGLVRMSRIFLGSRDTSLKQGSQFAHRCYRHLRGQAYEACDVPDGPEAALTIRAEVLPIPTGPCIPSL